MFEHLGKAQAVVTGGASGLGEATARALAARGLGVTIFDLNEARGQSLADEVGAKFAKTDVSNSGSVAASFADLPNDAPLRLVINCAGIGGAAKTVSRGKPHAFDAFQRTINVNLIGTFNVASQGAAIMAAQEPFNDDGARGMILNTASVAAYDGQVGQLAYAASKGGIVAMTLPMARDLADKGVRVCTIAPGLFLTPLMDELPTEVQQSLGSQVPFPSRLGQADEFAHLACSIIDNPMMNGEVVRLDGGIRMAPR